MIDKSQKYRVLRAVSFLQPPMVQDGAVSPIQISYHTGLGEHRVKIICGQLTNSRDPWLFLWCKTPEKRYRVTTLGELVLCDANDDPMMLNNETAWIDAVRWPSDERMSQLENVAIPTGSSIGGTLDSDHWLWRSTRGLLEHADGIEDEDEIEEAWRSA